MSIWDIINPWGALRRERDTVAFLRIRLADANNAADRLGIEKRELQTECSNVALKSLRRATEVNRLTRLVAKGHFRNPKTGRIGKRGETFE